MGNNEFSWSGLKVVASSRSECFGEAYWTGILGLSYSFFYVIVVTHSYAWISMYFKCDISTDFPKSVIVKASP